APDYWGFSIRSGAHISLVDTGSGHVLRAFRSEEEREMMIAEHVRSRSEIELGPEFYDIFHQSRERGYEMMASAQTSC
ncbi:IclR family transcriptional regulator, partial [Rhizobium ruizarguesonis]